MSRERDLVGKAVTVYLSGGWEVSGLVESVSDKKIVIKDHETGELYLSFMDKVSCLRLDTISNNRRLRVPEEAPSPPVTEDASTGFPMNKMAYDDSVMTIPQGLLKDLPDDDNDFSVSFGAKSSGEKIDGRGGLEFRVSDDSSKED